MQQSFVIVFFGIILAAILIPLPAFLLDILLAFAIGFSLVVLILVLNVKSPLELSSFPSILLIGTLLRLSLNIAAARRILLYGNEGPSAAGHIIEAFGRFVVGGNVVVGLIIFLIFIVINFVVITKGAERVSEVAARFTLDAMPGKQMSIDADLNAGLINEQEAKQRRKELRKRSGILRCHGRCF
jgi:Flagellar biosynthesis pathway, component FlhA